MSAPQFLAVYVIAKDRTQYVLRLREEIRQRKATRRLDRAIDLLLVAADQMGMTDEKIRQRLAASMAVKENE